MRIKVIASKPAEGQDNINHLIGKEFETVPFKDFDPDTRKEMQAIGEIAIKTNEGQYILNKSEYEVI